jgi:hypothetical protein
MSVAEVEPWLGPNLNYGPGTKWQAEQKPIRQRRRGGIYCVA